MDIIKIIGIGITVIILTTVLKNYKPEYAVVVLVITAIGFFFYIINIIQMVFEYIINVCAVYGVDIKYFEILFKTLGVSYICEFAVAICKDSGESAIGVKIDVAGKITILLMTLPLYKDFVEVVIKLLP